MPSKEVYSDDWWLDRNDENRCIAHRKNGDRCLKPAIRGADVCRAEHRAQQGRPFLDAATLADVWGVDMEFTLRPGGYCPRAAQTVGDGEDFRAAVARA